MLLALLTILVVSSAESFATETWLSQRIEWKYGKEGYMCA